jgi:hypothetical protein
MTALTEKQRTFIRRLADLCEEYNATFTYTINDDGIHILADNKEVFVGFLFDAALELREAAAH